MKRFGRLVILAMMTLGLMAPGLAGTASAQDANLCTDADGADSGTKIGRYTVVYGSGGAGSQIVLSDGTGTLSGGSGNDVLCAWGGGNILDGGSGSDLLIVMDGTGNELYGGSGNDTMIGDVDDYFDGGSGRNEIVKSEPVLGTITAEVGSFEYPGGPFNCGVQVELIGFPDDDYIVHTDVTGFLADDSPFTSVGGYVSGVSLSWGFGQFESGSVEVTVDGVTSGLIAFENCSQHPLSD